GLPGVVLGLSSAFLGLYALGRGLGIEEKIDETVERVRGGLYAGRVTLITYVVALALLVVAGVEGLNSVRRMNTTLTNPGALITIAAFVDGAIIWAAAAGLTSSLGQITDEYLGDRFEWRYLNAPFYIIAIATVLHGTSAFLLGKVHLSYLAGSLAAGTILGVISTLSFAVIESNR
ncbi:MAG: DUF373 family protein, partial [Halobacteriaceae archaeon]